MKRILTILVFACAMCAVYGQSNKKAKKLDEYYVNADFEVCRYDESSYRVLVQKEADSIRVYTSLVYNDQLYKVETYKILTDSIQEKWGTQQLYYYDGKLRLHQFIDPKLGTDTQVSFGEKGNVEKELVINKVTGESSSMLYYGNGAKKSLTKTVRDIHGNEKTDYTVWAENGRVAREHRLENHKTVYLKMYDENGNVSLKMPFEQGDKIYMTDEGNATTHSNAVAYGIVNIEGDSLKFNMHNMEGRPTGVMNFKAYTPEEVIVWGVQKQYYTTTVQQTDSIVQYCAIDGEPIVEHKYYSDGNLMSTKTVTLDPVRVKDVELRQYYPNGILRRIQKKHDNKLVEGHVYDSAGNETFPFYEFNE